MVNADEEQLLPAQIDYATYFNNNLLQSYGNTIFPLQADNIIQYAPIGKLFKYNGKYSIKSEINDENILYWYLIILCQVGLAFSVILQ